jgi:hypothetical protein
MMTLSNPDDQMPVMGALPKTDVFQMLQVIAKQAAASGLYGGVGNESKIFMVLLAAQELGIKPMMALNGGIWNIQGKIEVSAKLMNAMIRRYGHSINIVECNDKKCVLLGKRADNGDSFTSEFSVEDAVKAGIAGRDTWKKYTEDMLYSRAMSRLARRLFADVIGTAYVEGEIVDALAIKEDERKGKIIEIQEPTKAETPKETAEEFMKREMIEHDAEDIRAFRAFINQFESIDKDEIKTYLLLYSNHWKLTIPEALASFSSKEDFLGKFSKWKVYKAKEEEKMVNA